MTIYQVTHKMQFHLQQCRNTFYYETQVGDPSTSEWQDIVDEIRADILAEILSRLVAQWLFYGIDVREVDTAGLPSVEYLPTLGNIVGTHASDSTATQIALLVGVQGLTAAPRRARSYLCGFAETYVLNSLWDSAAIGDAETFIDLQSVLNAAGANELQRVSVKWNTGHTLVTAWNNIAGRPAKASVVPATQRRRRLGVGI